MFEFIEEKSEKIPKRWRGLSLSFEKPLSGLYFWGQSKGQLAGANADSGSVSPSLMAFQEGGHGIDDAKRRAAGSKPTRGQGSPKPYNHSTQT